MNKTLPNDHIDSKEQKDVEDCFIGRRMTYFEKCNKEVKNEEWREHILSYNHLERAVGKKIVKFVR